MSKSVERNERETTSKKEMENVLPILCLKRKLTLHSPFISKVGLVCRQKTRPPLRIFTFLRYILPYTAASTVTVAQRQLPNRNTVLPRRQIFMGSISTPNVCTQVALQHHHRYLHFDRHRLGVASICTEFGRPLGSNWTGNNTNIIYRINTKLFPYDQSKR